MAPLIALAFGPTWAPLSSQLERGAGARVEAGVARGEARLVVSVEQDTFAYTGTWEDFDAGVPLRDDGVLTRAGFGARAVTTRGVYAFGGGAEVGPAVWRCPAPVEDWQGWSETIPKPRVLGLWIGAHGEAARGLTENVDLRVAVDAGWSSIPGTGALVGARVGLGARF